MKAEVKTNKGRIDAVIIDKEIYILKFKFNGDKNRALNQIKEKKYLSFRRCVHRQKCGGMGGC